jgi:hypothetical protein
MGGDGNRVGGEERKTRKRRKEEKREEQARGEERRGEERRGGGASADLEKLVLLGKAVELGAGLPEIDDESPNKLTSSLGNLPGIEA